MSADFNNPTVDDQYTEILPQIRDNQKANAVMFNGVSVSNIPVMAVQFVSGQFNVWSGSAWDVKAVSVSGGGTGATNAADARANLGISSTSEADALYLKVNSNLSDLNDKTTARSELDVYGKSEMPGATTSIKGFTQLNDTLTSTSVDLALTAAQGKALKDELDGFIDVGFYQEETVGVSGGLLSGLSKVVRVGSLVTISGEYVHTSSDFILSSTGLIPSWARPPSNTVQNSYLASSEQRDVAVNPSGQLIFSYAAVSTTTNNFTLSYTV